MLPSSGYFSHLVCPYHEKGNCQRVYCHFKHKKIEQTVSYTPTPVHLLQKQPKPVQPSGSVYKPTPIDKLKQTVVQAKPEPANSDNGNAKPKATKSKSGPEDDCVFKKIESKLSSIFESNDETTTDEDEIVIIKEGSYSVTYTLYVAWCTNEIFWTVLSLLSIIDRPGALLEDN